MTNLFEAAICLRMLRWLRFVSACGAIGVVLCGLPAQAATGKVIKVLPLFLDLKGRQALSPSLYDRDAYQAILHQHPEKRSGLRYAIQWKTKGGVWEPLKLRLEVRGIAEGNVPRELTIDKNVDPGGRFSRWSSITLGREEYAVLGEVTAWRVTLWEGEQMLGEQKSFLW
jgi:hypothetical protein